jgi:histone-lysine N-methyltransferase SETMAR
MLFWELLTGNDTVTAVVYCNQLHQLAAVNREKRPRRVDVNLLHDNARPHVASATRRQLEQLGWTTVPHPAYSPDIAPSDYHLFRSLKNFLRSKTYSNFNDLKSDLELFFESQTPAFWAEGIQSLPERWRQVVDTNGDNIID